MPVLLLSDVEARAAAIVAAFFPRGRPVRYAFYADDEIAVFLGEVAAAREALLQLKDELQAEMAAIRRRFAARRASAGDAILLAPLLNEATTAHLAARSRERVSRNERAQLAPYHQAVAIVDGYLQRLDVLTQDAEALLAEPPPAAWDADEDAEADDTQTAADDGVIRDAGGQGTEVPPAAAMPETDTLVADTPPSDSPSTSNHPGPTPDDVGATAERPALLEPPSEPDDNNAPDEAPAS